MIRLDGNQGVAMKKPLSMPDEQQPRNITRADIVMTEGFGLEVDGRMKTVFDTNEAAQKSALELKTQYPMLQVKVLWRRHGRWWNCRQKKKLSLLMNEARMGEKRRLRRKSWVRYRLW